MKTYDISYYSSVEAMECRDAGDGSRPTRLYVEIEAKSEAEAKVLFLASPAASDCPYDIEVEGAG